MPHLLGHIRPRHQRMAISCTVGTVPNLQAAVKALISDTPPYRQDLLGIYVIKNVADVVGTLYRVRVGGEVVEDVPGFCFQIRRIGKEAAQFLRVSGGLMFQLVKVAI